MTRRLCGSLHAVDAYAQVPAGSFPPRLDAASIEQIEKDAERAAKTAFDVSFKVGRFRAHRYLIARDPVNAIAEAALSGSAIVVSGAISCSGSKD